MPPVGDTTQLMPSAVVTLVENIVEHEAYSDDSFIGRLHENSCWDHEKYWQLEWALYELAGKDTGLPDISCFRIFSYTMLLFSCHFDPVDGFAISNLDDEDVREFRERFQLVFEGFVSGKTPSLDSFMRNPLLTTSTA